jgi:hypothetical protein
VIISEHDTVDFNTLPLDALGFSDGEFVSIGYESPNSPWTTVVLPPGDAVRCISQLPTDANCFFGVNPVTGPARTNSGRGNEANVTRLAGLPVDLDVKPGACPSLDVADAIIAEVGIILGTRPSITVDSGTGRHAYWPASDGHITDGDITVARALVRRFGRLVAVVAGKHDVRVDAVFDLPRMMRVPGTFNCKAALG